MAAASTVAAPEAADTGFSHPGDGWYQIEAKGDHPNARAGIVQVIDDQACASIVNRFNAQAAKPGFAGMLIDHEHFKHDDEKETLAYGWLTGLENRPDGIYGQIRWTGTGRKSVDAGDYRFFSTEYDMADMQIVSASKPRKLRPLALDGLTLTNVNNNKGQKPITNRILNRQLYDYMNTTFEPEIPEAQRNSGAARNMAQSLAATTGLPFSECWNRVRLSHSHLFGLPSREAEQRQRQEESEANLRRTLARNRHSSVSLSRAATGDPRTASERFHGNQRYSEGEEPARIVNRAHGTGEAYDLVVNFQRTQNISTFGEAWTRAKARHPEWFFEVA